MKESEEDEKQRSGGYGWYGRFGSYIGPGVERLVMENSNHLSVSDALHVNLSLD